MEKSGLRKPKDGGRTHTVAVETTDEHAIEHIRHNGVSTGDANAFAPADAGITLAIARAERGVNRCIMGKRVRPNPILESAGAGGKDGGNGFKGHGER
ncbi:MAG: hypothetical protein ACRD9W_02545 [Terriglobia bacterium]